MAKQLSDFWWLKRGSRQKYVCPLLMTFSLWGWRLRGKSAHWYSCSETAGIYMDGGRSKWEAPCLFPRWLIHAECNFRNWRIRTSALSRRLLREERLRG